MTPKKEPAPKRKRVAKPKERAVTVKELRTALLQAERTIVFNARHEAERVLRDASEIRAADMRPLAAKIGELERQLIAKNISSIDQRRDFFAAFALQALVGSNLSEEYKVRRAWMYADLMIEQGHTRYDLLPINGAARTPTHLQRQDDA